MYHMGITPKLKRVYLAIQFYHVKIVIVNNFHLQNKDFVYLNKILLLDLWSFLAYIL